jgi:hypothetical protein
MIRVWVFQLIVSLIISHTSGAKRIKQKPNVISCLVIVVISPSLFKVYLVDLSPSSTSVFPQKTFWGLYKLVQACSSQKRLKVTR